MELNWVKLKGFKRFEEATLNTSGKVIALLGPNEAGKSSLLQALFYLNDERPLKPDNELRRDKKFNDQDVVVEAAFILSEEDRESIADLYQKKFQDNQPQWLYIQKTASGKRQFKIRPNLDRKHKHKHKNETGIEPNQDAIEILKKRIPKFLIFDGESRNLQSYFSLGDLQKTKPNKALQNLLRLANIKDIQEIADSSRNRPKLKSIINKANKQILETYEGKWSQAELWPVLEVIPNQLRVSIETSTGDDFDLTQRSDGLRQFIALINFLEVENAEKPILLIDEAEQHLHYDAQADLIKIFSQQKFASKIIYTTHSIGCLPEDLGMGVKLISPSNNSEETSTIYNKFWSADKRPGILSLLFGMGASQSVFMALHNSVFVEGPTDMLLLPTLLRQATQKDHLGFQIVQGIATTPQANFGLLKNDASKVAFLVDNDDEGETYKKQLIGAKIDANIFKLPDKVAVLEDYISKNLYLEAVNHEIKIWNDKVTKEDLMSLDDIPNTNRPKAVEEWCKDKKLKSPQKISIVYYLLDLATGDRQEKLIEDRLKDSLAELYKNLSITLQLPR